MRATLAILLTLAVPLAAAGHGRMRRVPVSELEPLARAALGAALPEGARVRQLVLPSTVSVGQGELRVEVPQLAELRTGRHSVSFLITAGSDRPVRFSGLADVESAPRRTVVRGAMVSVVVRTPGVTIAARGQTQALAVVGEMVPVLLDGGRKVLTGRVIDADTVEVSP